MPPPLRKDQGPYQAGDVKLKLVVTPPTLTDEEARAWLAQTVPPAGGAPRTIDVEEVPGA